MPCLHLRHLYCGREGNRDGRGNTQKQNTCEKSTTDPEASFPALKGFSMTLKCVVTCSLSCLFRTKFYKLPSRLRLIRECSHILKQAMRTLLVRCTCTCTCIIKAHVQIHLEMQVSFCLVCHQTVFTCRGESLRLLHWSMESYMSVKLRLGNQWPTREARRPLIFQAKLSTHVWFHFRHALSLHATCATTAKHIHLIMFHLKVSSSARTQRLVDKLLNYKMQRAPV